MPKIVVDSELRNRLNGLSEQLEFCDETGHTLGFFQPVASSSSAGEDASPFTREQLEKFAEQRSGRPLPDILKDLPGA